MKPLDNKDQLAYIVGRFGPEGHRVAKDMGLLPDKPAHPEKSLHGALQYTPHNLPEEDDLPEVTALCITYGRFHLLQRAIACFLLQDYKNKRMIIVNDAPMDLNCECLPENIKVINCKKRFETVGHKRQFALEAAETPFVAHWDDDDIYMPWHLRYACCILHEYNYINKTGIVRPDGSWIINHNEDGSETYAMCKHNLEAAYVFFRQKALMYGGYSHKNVGQEFDLMQRFVSKSNYSTFDIWPLISHAYGRGEQTIGHITNDGTLDTFAKENTDYGDFHFLIGDVHYPFEWATTLTSEIWESMLESVKLNMTEAEYEKISDLFKKIDNA